MTTFPLDTLGPTIDDTGISAPSFADILTSLKTSFLNLYGQDANLDDDTQDGQFLGVMASAINDTNSATIAAFNARSPSSAQGAGLSSVVKLNGLLREPLSNSTVDVTITGTAGLTVTNGVVGDNVGLGTRWNLMPEFVIPDSGEVVITATCTVSGAITAEAHTITQILTPTVGWLTADNVASADPGNPVEDDAALRRRQSVSQSQASQSPFSATLGAIRNLSGVSRARGYENQNATPDANGVPGHSVSFVVGGGDATEIAETIARKKTIGTGTYGTTSVVILDPTGSNVTIDFFALDLTTVPVEVTITALSGYVDTTGVLIQAAVADYITSLDIGSIVYLTKVEAIASLMTSPLNTTFDVTAVTLNGVAADFVVDFNKAAFTTTGDVTVTVGP